MDEQMPIPIDTDPLSYYAAPGPMTDPGELAIAKMEHQELRQMLESLRDDYRMVIILRFLSDLSPDETAQVMGKSTGAIRVLQHRALASLRKLLVS